MVTLDGLGYKFAGWEAAGGIREASGRLAWLSGAAKAEGIWSKGGKTGVPGGSKLPTTRLQTRSYKLPTCQNPGLQGLHGLHVTILQGYMAYRLLAATRSSTAWWPTRGRRIYWWFRMCLVGFCGQKH